MGVLPGTIVFPKNPHLLARTGKDGKKASIPQKARIAREDPEIDFEDFDGNVEAEADDSRSVKLRLHEDELMQHLHASKALPDSTNAMQIALLASVAATQRRQMKMGRQESADLVPNQVVVHYFAVNSLEFNTSYISGQVINFNSIIV